MVQTILRMHDVEEACGLHRTTIWRKVNAGLFPAPIKITNRARGWLESEVSDWQRARIADRDGGDA